MTKETHLVRWTDDRGAHHTGYLLMVEGEAFYNESGSSHILRRKPENVMHIPGINVLVIPHFQPPHSIEPIWVELPELHRLSMRREWEHSQPPPIQGCHDY